MLVVVGALLSPSTSSRSSNLANVARQASIVGIIGVGMTFVILTAGIDLSVGSIVGFAAITLASLMAAGVPWPLAVLAALAAGALVGALNGLGITKGRLQPFIMTLGMLVIARGVTMTIRRQAHAASDRRLRTSPGSANGNVLGVPDPVRSCWRYRGCLAWFVLRYTPFGRHVYAVGDNLEAARLVGHLDEPGDLLRLRHQRALRRGRGPDHRVARLTAGEPSQGEGFELDAIAIVVIGGTSLFGGEGGIIGTLVGAAIVAVDRTTCSTSSVSRRSPSRSSRA